MSTSKKFLAAVALVAGLMSSSFAATAVAGGQGGGSCHSGGYCGGGHYGSCGYRYGCGYYGGHGCCYAVGYCGSCDSGCYGSYYPYYGYGWYRDHDRDGRRFQPESRITMTSRPGNPVR